jgi:hypothetical protein
MPALLLKLIPFRDYAYAALAIAAVVWFLHHDHVERDIGAARETKAVAVATAKANTAAKAEIDRLNAAHADDVAQIEARYENAIRDNDASHAADLQRLRNSAASSGKANPVLGGASGGTAPTETGAGSAGSLGSVPADIALKLADSLRADDAALDKCYADRDDLTGK